MSEVRKYGMTPKGQPMPQTIEEWKHLVDLDEVALHKMAKELGELRAKVSRLTQQNHSLRRSNSKMSLDKRSTGSLTPPDHIVDANKKVTRFEVIDHTWAGTGRIVNMTHYDVSVELSYQDDGKTLKVFLKDVAHEPSIQTKVS
jgi:hypothetical protein